MPGTTGDDELVGGPGSDLLDGDAGFDAVTYAGVATSEGIVVTLSGGKTATIATSLNTIRGSLYAAAPGGSQDIGLDRLNRVECVIGTSNADTFVATAGFSADFGKLVEFQGRGGNDTIKGNGETRISYRAALAGVEVDLKLGFARSGAENDGAGIGVDTLQGGINAVIGSAFDDHIAGSDAAVQETFVGHAGYDRIDGRLGLLDRVDYLVTGADALTVTGGVVVHLGHGVGYDNWGHTDTLAGIERVRGSALADQITGNAIANELDGGSGDDVLDGGAGADKLIGGEGIDTASYAEAAGAVSVTAGSGSGNKGEAAGDKYSSIEIYALSNYADIFKGATGNDEAYGAAGGDVMSGGAGKDRLSGDDGADTLKGEAGDDVLDGGADGDILDGGDGIDALLGGDGADVLTGGKGGDHLDGGAGFDVASYAASAAVQIDRAEPSRSTGDAAGDTYAGIEGFVLTRLADTFSGSADDERVSGGAGNDVLSGGGGNDVLEGGAGADRLDGGEGDADAAIYLSAAAGVVVDLVIAKNSAGDAAGDVYAGIETFRLSNKNDRFVGAADVSNLASGEGGSDVLIGGSAGDVLHGDSESDAEGAGDVLRGLDGDDLLVGGVGDDELDGGAGTDWLEGGDGNDVLTGGAGADALVGGAGTDTASYAGAAPVSGSSGVTLDFTGGAFAGTGDATGDAFESVERFVLSAYDDTYLADDTTGAADTIDGGAGNDILRGAGGDDLLVGGAGGDVLDGGGGEDRVSYAGAKAAVKLDLLTGQHTGDAAGDTLIAVEAVTLSDLDDVFVGDAAAWRVSGGAGRDRITGGAGDDVIDGGAGADILDGGLGDDTVSFATATAAVAVNTAKGTHAGAAAGEKILNFEIYELSRFDDTFLGAIAGEVVVGGAGNDKLDGGAGDDTLQGGDGNDVLTGGAGADVIDGGAGLDTASYKTAAAGVGIDLVAGMGTAGDATGDLLYDIERFELTKLADLVVLGATAVTVAGGLGADTYRFAGNGGVRHTITDFLAGTGAGDVLDVSAFAFADLAAVKAAMVQLTTKDVLLHLDGDDSVLLANTTIGKFVADDFKLA